MPHIVRTMAESLPTDGVVTLRAWGEADADELVACLDGDEEIARWLDRIPQPYKREHALEFFGWTGETTFAVTDSATGRVVGGIGLRWNEARDVGEVGYWMRADARGRGLTTRAVLLVSRLAFDEGAARVQLRAETDNAASRRVAEKAGFTFEGVLRSAHHSARLGRRVDWAMYSVLPGEL
jgi:RimJ/RimL family protein N-acetyltransferase